MSQSTSLLAAMQNTDQKTPTGINMTMLKYEVIQARIRRDLMQSYVVWNVLPPKGCEFYMSLGLPGGRIAAFLRITLPSGRSETYEETGKFYSSRREAKDSVYQHAVRMGVLDFLATELPGGYPALPLVSGLEPAPVPTASSSSPSAAGGVVDAGAALSPPEAIQQDDSDASTTSSAALPPGPTQACTTSGGLDAVLIQVPLASPSSDVLPLQPVPEPLSTHSIHAGHAPASPGANYQGGLLGVASSFIGRLVAMALPQRADAPKATKRARTDDETVVAPQSAHGEPSETRPMKKLKGVHGTSYSDILADHCQKSRLEQPWIYFRRSAISTEVEYMSTTVGSMHFELLEPCDSVEVGEERLSKIALEGLGVDVASNQE